MLTVLGLLVYAVLQRQVRLYLRTHDQQLPGKQRGDGDPDGGRGVVLVFPSHDGAMTPRDHRDPADVRRTPVSPAGL